MLREIAERNGRQPYSRLPQKQYTALSQEHALTKVSISPLLALQPFITECQ